MLDEDDKVKVARRMLAAIEQGDEPTLRAVYAEDVVQVEHPNQLKKKGDRRGLQQMLSDLKRGKALLRSEHYEVMQAIVMGDRLALQVKWTGVVDMAIGALQAGDSMICESAIFLKFQGDRIVEQHNYDCFEDFLTPRAA